MKDAFSVSSAERGAQVATTNHCLGQRSIYHLSMMRRVELFVSSECIVIVRSAPIVILRSAATKDLLFSNQQQILRFAQDDS
jgi:lipoate-protein ligase B